MALYVVSIIVSIFVHLYGNDPNQGLSNLFSLVKVWTESALGVFEPEKRIADYHCNFQNRLHSCGKPGSKDREAL